MDKINEYDQTKELLNLVREGMFSEDDPDDADAIETNDEEVIDNNIIEINQEDMASFRELFSPLTHSVVVSDLTIYKDSENIVGTGKLKGIGDLSWVFDLNKGLTITTIDFRLDNGDTISDINKLKGIYTNWQKDWGNKLQTEYLNQVN